jgi:cytochrome c1
MNAAPELFVRRGGAAMALAATVAALCLAGCRNHASPVAAMAAPDVDRGRAAIAHYSCGACHVIDGVANAHGRVGPMLNRFREQTMIAGRLPNTTDNLVRWIRDPQAVDSGNAMPNLGIDEPTARDIAAYLYTVR